MGKSRGEHMWDLATYPHQQSEALHQLIRELRQDLAQERQVNAANTATILWLKAVIEQWHNTGDVQGPLPERVEEYFIGALPLTGYPNGAILHDPSNNADQGATTAAVRHSPHLDLGLGPHEGRVVLDDRYDAAHSEEEHDGGLGSGDWLKEQET